LITTVRSVEVAFRGVENFTFGVARKSPVTETDLDVEPDGVLTHFELEAAEVVDVDVGVPELQAARARMAPAAAIRERVLRTGSLSEDKG
jgi:hypothetical protein